VLPMSTGRLRIQATKRVGGRAQIPSLAGQQGAPERQAHLRVVGDMSAFSRSQPPPTSCRCTRYSAAISPGVMNSTVATQRIANGKAEVGAQGAVVQGGFGHRAKWETTVAERTGDSCTARPGFQALRQVGLATASRSVNTSNLAIPIDVVW